MIPERVALARLFTNCCCVDVWRHLFPSRPGFTWTRRDGVRSSRIDLIGCPTIWAPFILSCDLLPCPFSDLAWMVSLLNFRFTFGMFLGWIWWKFSIFVFLLVLSTRSQRRGVISLTFNKGDSLDPGNWRPISLLNVHYKIASKAIAGWLLRVIHLVVNCDQSCGVPSRFIGDTVA